MDRIILLCLALAACSEISAKAPVPAPIAAVQPMAVAPLVAPVVPTVKPNPHTLLEATLADIQASLRQARDRNISK